MSKPCCPHGAARFAAAGALLAFCVSAPAQPANDRCIDAIAVVGQGTVAFSNVGATTDGPSPCAEQGADVWARYVPTAPGSIEVSTCTPALTFDTVVSAYRECPEDPNDVALLLGCNDDGPDSLCELSGGSLLRVPVGWAPVIIQIGGKGGQQGECELSVTPCTADFDADGVIGLGDLAILLADYGVACGSAAACDGDLEPDGDVDLTDLAVLLGRFGTECP